MHMDTFRAYALLGLSLSLGWLLARIWPGVYTLPISLVYMLVILFVVRTWIWRAIE